MDQAWTQTLNSLVNICGFAAVGWYLLTKSLPSIQQQFLDALKEQREESRNQRQETKQSLDAVLAHCERESTKRDDAQARNTAEVTMAIKDQREVLEEVRDALKTLHYSALFTEREISGMLLKREQAG